MIVKKKLYPCVPLQAAALLLSVHPTLVVLNTSQSLNQMPFALDDARALPCLTCRPQFFKTCSVDVTYFGSNSSIPEHTRTWLCQMRPKGKWLVLGNHQRYLLGRDLMYLMGFPLHRMACGVPESATWIVHWGSAEF